MLCSTEQVQALQRHRGTKATEEGNILPFVFSPPQFPLAWNKWKRTQLRLQSKVSGRIVIRLHRSRLIKGGASTPSTEIWAGEQAWQVYMQQCITVLDYLHPRHDGSSKGTGAIASHTWGLCKGYANYCWPFNLRLYGTLHWWRHI